MTTKEIMDDDAAIIFSVDGSLTLSTPKGDNKKELVPNNVLFATSLFVLLHEDAKLAENIKNKWHELAERVLVEEEESVST